LILVVHVLLVTFVANNPTTNLCEHPIETATVTTEFIDAVISTLGLLEIVHQPNNEQCLTLCYIRSPKT
jgi:hypothetical protein